LVESRRTFVLLGYRRASADGREYAWKALP
jgi:hypothetical protein